MILKLNCDSDLVEGVSRVSDILKIELGDGITVNAVRGERIGAALSGGVGTIYYKRRHHFFRELSVFVENARKSDSFDITERDDFDTVSVMIQATGAPVPSVKGVYKMLNHLALMGYSMAMLYTENTVELKSRKYFGYMAGKFNYDELKAIDDYADSLGIEMIPCLECYGHMAAYLLWPEASDIKDTPTVLLAREEKTFEFLDELIRTASAPYRSKRIHIGMDEAHGMGTGAFLNKHGYVPPREIFDEFMERLVGITDKYGLIPMMWSDMYFRNVSKTDYYYEMDAEIPESTKKRIPKSVQLVFWHYGECWACDDAMLRLHRELNRDVIFAGATWGWAGHFADHIFARETMRISLDACRKHGVREMMNTYWTKGDAIPSAQLLALSDAAEMCYNKAPDEKHFKSRFECVTGASYDVFAAASLYHNDTDKLNTVFGDGVGDRGVHSRRFIGQQLFWQDILSGMYDALLYEHPMSEHYRAAAENLSEEKNEAWRYFREYVYNSLSYLALKCEIAEKIAPAYKAGDRATLSVVKDELLPKLIELTERVHESHRKAWFSECRAANWLCVDARYGSIKERCKTAIIRLGEYLSGEIDEIEELAEERLPKKTSGFDNYLRVFTPTQTI